MTAIKIALVGMPGSGKSTVGQALAQLTGWPFHDLDGWLTERWSMSIAEQFNEWGEITFRERERDALLHHLRLPSPMVLATGGGTPVWHEQMKTLLESSKVVWLDVDSREICLRLTQNPEVRPLLASQTPATAPDLTQMTLKRIQYLNEERRATYAQAHIHLKAIRPPEQLAAEILIAIENYTPLSSQFY